MLYDPTKKYAAKVVLTVQDSTDDVSDPDSERVLVLETPRGDTNLPGGGIEYAVDDEGYVNFLETECEAIGREVIEELGDGFEVVIEEDPVFGVWGPIRGERTAYWTVFRGMVRIRQDKLPLQPCQISSENKHFCLPEKCKVQDIDKTHGGLAVKAVSTEVSIQKRVIAPVFDPRQNELFWERVDELERQEAPSE